MAVVTSVPMTYNAALLQARACDGSQGRSLSAVTHNTRRGRQSRVSGTGEYFLSAAESQGTLGVGGARRGWGRGSGAEGEGVLPRDHLQLWGDGGGEGGERGMADSVLEQPSVTQFSRHAYPCNRISLADPPNKD